MKTVKFKNKLYAYFFMTKKDLACMSCKKNIANVGGATFKCPECGKFDIIRCTHCRKIAAKYKCAVCGFEGPN